VVDRVEGVLGKDLGGLDVAVPGAAADVRLARGVGQRLADRKRRGATEGGARVLVVARAVGGTTAPVDHLADLRQVDRDAADRGGRSYLVSAERRVAQVD